MSVLTVLAGVAFAGWPLGAEIPGAVVADVTPEGLDAVTDLATTFIPSEIAIPDTFLADSSCSWIGCTYEYNVSFTNAVAYLRVDSLTIEPGTGVLNLAGSLTVALNDANDPAVLSADATAIGFISVSETCDAWLDPVPVNLNAAIQLTLLPDGTIDAYVPPLVAPDLVALGVSDQLQLSGCLTGDVLDILDFLGIDVVEIALDALQPQVDALVADLAPELESTLEESFGAVSTLAGSVDVLGAPLDYALRPSELTIVPDGIRIGISGSLNTVPDPCVAQYGITESLATSAALPDIGAFPNTLGDVPPLSVAADDDFLNAALFALWETGVLCQNLDASSAGDLGLPLPLDTSLLALLAPGVFDDLFPETEPLVIQLAPTQPPTASPQGEHDINVAVDGLELDLFGSLDGRASRLVSLNLEVDAGVDLAFDNATGNLALAVALGGEDVTPSVVYNELKPDANATIAASFDGLFDSLVAPLLGSLLSDLVFPIPSFEGFGVTGLDILPTGALDIDPSGGKGDRIGVFGTVGSVSYPSSGCTDTSTTGCDAGLSCDANGGVPARAWIIAAGLAAALRRRSR
jgi:hypothetical protein